ncbi:MAG: hypothetical protein ABSD75_16235 [Terriglobales bacterium]|jgi:hypothetical protein
MRRRALVRSRYCHVFLVLFLPVLLASFSLRTPSTYYVSTSGNDNNPGTHALPWLTLQHAANTATAGDTVYVEGGTYNETVIFQTHSGTSSAPIVFSNYPGQVPIIDGTGLNAARAQALVEMYDVNYITFRGFVVRNYTTDSSSVTPAGILVEGFGRGIRILNNQVYDISTSSEESGNSLPLIAYGTSRVPITQLVMSGNEVYNSKVGSSQGLTTSGNVTNFEITNNLVHDIDNICIDLAGYWKAGPTGYDQAIYGEVSGNTVYNCSAISNPAADSYESDGIYCDGCGWMTIEDNVIINADLGIEVTSENQICKTNGTEWSGGTPGSGSAGTSTHPCYGKDVTVRNNLIWNSNAVGYSIGGYAKYTSGGGSGNGGGGTEAAVFVNNTLYNNAKTTGGDSEEQIQNQVGSAQGNYFENNVVYAGSYNQWMYSYNRTSKAYPAPPATLNWNLYYSTAGYVEGTSITWADVSRYTSFANWQSKSGEDAESVNSNPQFINLSATPPDFDINTSSPGYLTASTSLSCGVGWCDPNGDSPDSIYGATDLVGTAIRSSGRINMGAFQTTGLNNAVTATLTAGRYTLRPGGSTTLTAVVKATPPGAGVPSGTARFYVDSTLLQTATLLPTGVGRSAVAIPLSASQLATGSNSLYVVYSGNTIALGCCSASDPPGSGTQVPVYPSETSSSVTVTLQ